MALTTITSGGLGDNSVDTDQLAASAVETAKINNDAVTLAKMASGTDGAMLTYDADGNPVAITGTNGQVATSAGPDAVSAFEAAGGGITEADTWRITTDFTGAVNPITANWERPDTDGLGYLGTGVDNTTTPGTFIFPSTGLWLIEAKGYIRYTSWVSYGGLGIYTTVNDSSYGEAAIQHAAIPADGGYMGLFSSCIFDVTSTSTHKVQIGTTVSDASIIFNGTTGSNVTYVNFFKLGNT